MLPNCKQVAEQASENIDTPLTGMKRFKLKLHLLMCKHCSRYFEQIGLASKTVETIGLKENVNPEVREKVEKCYRELHVEKSNNSNQSES